MVRLSPRKIVESVAVELHGAPFTFEEVARERRLLLIAHDPAIVPASFERLDI